MEWLVLLLFALLAIAIVLYNRLVYDRERVRQAWSDVLVQLKRRHDLLPKLVDAVRTYADFESSVVAEATRLRSRQDAPEATAERARLESGVSGALGSLFAVAEAYPELRASEQWLHLQQNISEIENHIQSARRYYNGAVKELNVRIDAFPSNLVAIAFRFQPAQFFNLES